MTVDDAFDALERGDWVPASEFSSQASKLIVFSLIASGKVLYQHRWFKRGKWLRKVRP